MIAIQSTLPIETSALGRGRVLEMALRRLRQASFVNAWEGSFNGSSSKSQAQISDGLRLDGPFFACLRTSGASRGRRGTRRDHCHRLPHTDH
jgi:hypothetical protein